MGWVRGCSTWIHCSGPVLEGPPSCAPFCCENVPWRLHTSNAVSSVSSTAAVVMNLNCCTGGGCVLHGQGF